MITRKNLYRCLDRGHVGADTGSGSREIAPRPTCLRSTKPQALGGVIFCRRFGVPREPSVKRTAVFVDGQNLFHAAKEAFGCHYPNYNIYALASKVCGLQGWCLQQIRFYTGVPVAAVDPVWHGFWTNKLAAMGRKGIHVFRRPLKYRNRCQKCPHGHAVTSMVGKEKGIDVRIAIDVIRLAHRREYDVALVFSQDQDLSEVANEIREIAREQNRWIKIASAFPCSETTRNKRGINSTDWIRIDRATYDACIDPKDYRPQ